jgi:hypothetical protein
LLRVKNPTISVLRSSSITITWTTFPSCRLLKPSDEVAATEICKKKRRLRRIWRMILWLRLEWPRGSKRIRWGTMNRKQMKRRKRSLRKKKSLRMKRILMNKLRQGPGLVRKGSNLSR